MMEVTFALDSNGHLTVNAEDESTGQSDKITIANDKDRPNEEEIEKMIQDAATYADENLTLGFGCP